MLEIIREYNRLNGLRFSVIEFLVVGTVALYLAFGGAWNPFVGIGLAVNMITVATVGVRQIQHGEESEGNLWRLLTTSGYREEIARTHPNLPARTALLLIAALVPFLLTAWVIIRR